MTDAVAATGYSNGDRGKIHELSETDDALHYVEFDHGGRAWVYESEMDLELPEINDQPEADVVKFPRETDTALIPVEEHEAFAAADADDCLINVSAMQRDLPRGVVATITITG